MKNESFCYCYGFFYPRDRFLIKYLSQKHPVFSRLLSLLPAIFFLVSSGNIFNAGRRLPFSKTILERRGKKICEGLIFGQFFEEKSIGMRGFFFYMNSIKKSGESWWRGNEECWSHRVLL